MCDHKGSWFFSLSCLKMGVDYFYSFKPENGYQFLKPDEP